jgi:hypothetical protein
MPGVQIDLKRLDDLIQRKGVCLDWYRARRCPCLGPDGYMDPACPVCQGLGWARDPAKAIRALWAAHRPKRGLQEMGLVEQGSRSITPPRWVRLTDGDWIVQSQFRSRNSEVVTYGALPHDGDRLDSLAPLTVIDAWVRRGGKLLTLDAASYTAPAILATLPPGACERNSPINLDGTIPWQAGAPGGPEPGERVTIEYYMYEAFQVWRGDMPMQRGASDQRLPDRATCRAITRRRLIETAAPGG